MSKVRQRENYHIEVIEEDGLTKVFAVVYKGEVIHTIAPATIEIQDGIIATLDAGEDVQGWEDGTGITIWIPEKGE